MEKIFILNRKNQKISILIEQSQPQKGLAFVMHGLGGFKEQPHIQTIAEAFKEHGFTVVRFDTTNTLGESDGDYKNATITNYYEDLEDVLNWTKNQLWYKEPFILSGHSLGGICIALYAEKHPETILAIAPVSSVVSGKLTIEAEKEYNAQKFSKWEKTGWKREESHSKPGFIKELPWSHIIDRLKYDLLPEVSNLTMPVLLIVGENDTSTPPNHVKKLYDALPGSKELHIIKDGPHTIKDEGHLTEMKQIISDWLDKI